MALAIMRIDQAGLPAGTPAEGRVDGLITGAAVTLTSTDPGSTNKFQLLWVPTLDTTAVASLAPTGGGATPEWTFVPTAGVDGSWRIELIIDEGLPTEDREIRVFGIASPIHGLVTPALNEVGDPQATLLNAGPGVVDNTERNPSGSIKAWWPWMEGVTKTLETVALSETTAPLDLYVRDADGDDTNDGLSTANPLKTLVEAISRIPRTIGAGGRAVIHLGDGNYPSPDFGTRIFGDKLVVIGDGAGVGDGFNRVGPGLQTSETADTGTDATVVKKIGGGLTLDASRGKTIQLLTGPGSPQRKTIRRNTVDGFLPSQAFSPAPDDTTTYEIVESTVELAYSGNFTSTMELSGAGPVLPQDAADGDVPAYCVFQVRLDATDNPVPNINNATVCYYGIEIGGSGTFWPAWNNASVFIGTDSIVGQFAFIPETLGFAVSNTEWAGWGIGQVGANAVQWSPANSVIRGYIVAARLFLLGSVSWFMHGGRLFGVAGLDTLESNGATATVEGSVSAPVEIESSGAGNAVEASGQSSSIRLANTQLTSAAALVRVKQAGQISVFSSVTGTSSGAEAVDASSGGRALLFGAPALEGATPAVAYNPGGGSAGQISDFGSVGDFLAAADGSVIERVS